MSTTKTNPHPVRLEASDDQMVRELSNQTGISKAEIIRRCLRFALPQFESGAVNLLEYGAVRKSATGQKG